MLDSETTPNQRSTPVAQQRGQNHRADRHEGYENNEEHGPREQEAAQRAKPQLRWPNGFPSDHGIPIFAFLQNPLKDQRDDPGGHEQDGKGCRQREIGNGEGVVDAGREHKKSRSHAQKSRNAEVGDRTDESKQPPGQNRRHDEGQGDFAHDPIGVRP